MTRYDVQAVIVAAENLAAEYSKTASPQQRRECRRMLSEVRKAGHVVTKRIERVNRAFESYKRIVPKLDRELGRLRLEVGKNRVRLLQLQRRKGSR